MMKAQNDQPKIFVVDDDVPFTVLIKKHLQKSGYQNIYVHNSGRACLDAIETKPDIIILDYTMEPDFNGLKVLSLVKKKYKDIYVIMLTAAEKIELAIDSLRLGAYDYVVKNEKAFLKISNRVKKIIKEKQLSEKSR